MAFFRYYATFVSGNRRCTIDGGASRRCISARPQAQPEAESEVRTRALQETLYFKMKDRKKRLQEAFSEAHTLIGTWRPWSSSS